MIFHLFAGIFFSYIFPSEYKISNEPGKWLKILEESIDPFDFNILEREIPENCNDIFLMLMDNS